MTDPAAASRPVETTLYAEPEVVEGVKRGSMDELADWTVEADTVITFSRMSAASRRQG